MVFGMVFSPYCGFLFFVVTFLAFLIWNIDVLFGPTFFRPPGLRIFGIITPGNGLLFFRRGGPVLFLGMMFSPFVCLRLSLQVCNYLVFY